MSKFDDVARELETMGELSAREKWSGKAWSDPQVSGFVENWLLRKESERAAAAEARRDAREDKAIRLAWWANTIAIAAAIIAITAIIMARS